MMNLGLIVVLTTGMSATLAADSFVYNNDAECTIPFLSASIDSVSCIATTQWNEQEDHGDVCHFDDTMILSGAFELNQKVNRYFSATIKMCSHSSVNAFYQPKRCKSILKTIDMWEYAVVEEQYEEEEEVKEGYNYKSYYQDEESQKWSEAKEEYEQEQADELQTYLYPGLYAWNMELKIPTKSFYFGNGSRLRITMTLTPRNAYTIPYYRKVTYYTGPISDSKYKTDCYLTFNAVNVYEYGSSYRYFSAAGLGFLLLGAATYVSFRRRIACWSESDVKEILADDCHYCQHTGKESGQQQVTEPSLS